MSGTLLEVIFQNLMSLFPFVIIKSYARGVRWTLGRNPKELKPGPHWRVWLIHQVEEYNVVDEVLDLPVQSVITKDDKPICFSVNIGFRVTDVVTHCTGVQDFNESTAGLAMTHLAQRVREKTLADLVAEGGLKDLEKSLEGTLTTRLKAWGATVFSVGFINFAPGRAPLRIFLDQHTQGVLAPPPTALRR